MLFRSGLVGGVYRAHRAELFKMLFHIRVGAAAFGQITHLSLIHIYVVERNRLKGVVSARDLLLADPDTPLVDIIDDNVVTVKVTDDQEFVADVYKRQPSGSNRGPGSLPELLRWLPYFSRVPEDREVGLR